MFGDGSQTRSLCYVDDEVEGILRLLLSNETGPVNIGNPEEVTMLELAETVQDVVGNHPGIEFHPRPTDDPTVRRPDTSKAGGSSAGRRRSHCAKVSADSALVQGTPRRLTSLPDWAQFDRLGPNCPNGGSPRSKKTPPTRQWSPRCSSMWFDPSRAGPISTSDVARVGDEVRDRIPAAHGVDLTLALAHEPPLRDRSWSAACPISALSGTIPTTGRFVFWPSSTSRTKDGSLRKPHGPYGPAESSHS